MRQAADERSERRSAARIAEKSEGQRRQSGVAERGSKVACERCLTVRAVHHVSRTVVAYPKVVASSLHRFLQKLYSL